MSESHPVYSFQSGERVRLTAKFLRSTGQPHSEEARKVFTVQGRDGDYVVTDEMTDTSEFTPEELEADPSLQYRRIHHHNLHRVGALTTRNCPSDPLLGVL